VAELLVWPALLAYGEAAVAYAGSARRPGLLGALATWGVRLGWLAQTALLVVQGGRADGFPWSTWAGSLNLFVWLVVGAYLIWGCTPRFRLLGLAVMPFAAALFTVAAGLAALELWQERLLKRHRSEILRVRMPSLVALDRLTVVVIAVSLAALTLGLVPGFARLAEHGLDVLMAGTLVAWSLYAAILYLRVRRGRRALAARLAVLGLAAVLVLQLGLLVTHAA
jgi:ABC-type transport system involved in cytochrome c biogenesis permease subunit